ncbi:TetR family transcriptional regulator [Paenibacillus sp. LMG 31460]|uniref:TetR family transcriptional regulator n=1 Tax=Paenibacillus germinis TaxID=2654979 RepID=A0ABX1Z1C4_9BACL|nr:TetR/AcrR family transcriptional regulator [Paenibacillus germinis]NOU86199.1 TetR family transcriptional regulator [Paenibacillus germinis]
MSKNYKDIDRRVKRTRQFIQDALISLIAEKGFDALTVHEITERADVNRSTFYFHFMDKYDLLDQSVNEMLEKFAESLKSYDVNPDEKCPIERSAPLVQQFEHVAKHANFYKTMIGEKGIPSFAKRMKSAIEEAFYRKLEYSNMEHRQIPIPKDILCRYVASAHYGVIESWLEKDMPYSPAYMSSLLRELVKIGPLNAAGILKE